MEKTNFWRGKTCDRHELDEHAFLKSYIIKNFQ